jgi:hypothetical protein
MRRKRAFGRGRLLSILVAAGIGYFLGNWNATALRSSGPTPAQTVALRFPETFSSSPAQQAPVTEHTAAAMTAVTTAQLTLFNPQPMVSPPTASLPAAPVQLAEAEGADPSPAPVAAALQPAAVPAPAVRGGKVAEPKGAEPMSLPKPRPAVGVHRATRPGYVLDDAQLASIKQRLNLTPDQERMWPAVEAALRNVAFAREREAHRRGDSAGVDPNSAEVQDLKSAAIPLLMSFNDEQKDEVRSLAHVMGLDQLASQF